jgi:hypothetical protein
MVPDVCKDLMKAKHWQSEQVRNQKGPLRSAANGFKSYSLSTHVRAADDEHAEQSMSSDMGRSPSVLLEVRLPNRMPAVHERQHIAFIDFRNDASIAAKPGLRKTKIQRPSKRTTVWSSGNSSDCVG